MFILFFLGIWSFSNLSFLGQNRMDNLMKAHSYAARGVPNRRDEAG
jgi:hypothetical protein